MELVSVKKDKAPEAIQEVEAAFDPTILMERVENDIEMFNHVLDLFPDSYNESLRNIKLALEQRSCESLYEAAHYLKGEVLTLGRAISANLTEQLETVAHSGNIQEAIP